MTEVPHRLWLAGAVALLALTASACSSGMSSSSPATTSASKGASGGADRQAPGSSSGTGPSSGTSSGSSPSPTSGGSSGSGGSGSSGSSGSGSGGSGTSGSNPPSGGTKDTLPSLSDQFNADVTSFKSAANSAQHAVRQLPSNASAQEIAPTVAPLMTAATTFQAQLVNLRWPAGTQPDTQSLNENLGKLTAVIEEAQLSIGFGSANQFRSQLSSAIGAVDGAVSSVSAQTS